MAQSPLALNMRQHSPLLKSLTSMPPFQIILDPSYNFCLKLWGKKCLSSAHLFFFVLRCVTLESSLLKISNDLLQPMDSDKCTILISFSIQLSRSVIQGSTPKWLTSYVTDTVFERCFLWLNSGGFSYKTQL